MLDVDNLFVDENDPIINAMKNIEKGLYKIAIVLDGDKKVVGTITDGDIRRGFLDGNKINDQTKKIMNKDFKYIAVDDDIQKAAAILKKPLNPVKHLPVLDGAGKLRELLTGDIDLVKNKKNSVLIMAGGQGKRLKPYTNNLPKPMIRVNDIPILEIILKNCIEEGFINFYFSVFYLKDRIKEYFRNGSKWGVNITYLEEEKPLGTAGSLSLIRENLECPLLVLNGDVLTKVNLSALLDFHNSCASKTTICTRNYQIDIPFGVVNSEGSNFIAVEEKPTKNFKVNAGIYLLEPEVLKLIKKDIYIDMPDFIEIIKDKGNRISVFPIHEYWLDIGRKESLEMAKNNWPVD